MKKFLLINRDSTLIKETADLLPDSFEKLEFYPGAIANLAKIAQELDFEIVMISNTDSSGTENFSEKKFLPIQNFILKTFENEGVKFSEALIDKSLTHTHTHERTPTTRYTQGDYDLSRSFVIGSHPANAELAQNLNVKTIFLTPNPDKGREENRQIPKNLEKSIALKTNTWEEIYQFLKLSARRAKITRTTNETDILVEVGLDGTGKSEIQTGIGFFDHALDQIARHGGIDLKIKVKGDLHVDEHHTIEDTALALGEAFRKALGNKAGIQRYGFCLPMDDALAQVALDFGGRNWIVWKADFHREKIGQMPTEMFFHFFKSFSDAAACNLNIRAEGENEHHKIEAIFKAFARAVRMAVRRDANNMQLPSTKGVL